MSTSRPSALLGYRWAPCCGLLAVLLIVGPLSASAAGQTAHGPTAAKASSSTRGTSVAVSFMDGSNLKVVLRDREIPFTTPYGKLIIPLRDVRCIEFATRLPPDISARLDDAMTKLGRTDFGRREGASAALRELGPWAYGTLLRATHHSDPEVVRRVTDLRRQLREDVPEERLAVRKHDVIGTADSKFTGQIDVVVLHATTFQFGDMVLKLTDMRQLRSPLDRAEHGDQGFQVGRHVEAEWSNQWWPAEILERKNGQYRIHYTGYDSSFDEWVPRQLIRSAPSKPQDPEQLGRPAATRAARPRL